MDVSFCFYKNEGILTNDTGEGGWFFIFRLFVSILFFVNRISLYFFHIFYNNDILCLLILYFDWVVIACRDSFCSCPLYFFPYSLPSSSVSKSYFILAVLLRECLGKHSCMSPPFNIAILNGSFFFRETRWSKWSKSRLSKINHNNKQIDEYILFRQRGHI